MKYILPLLIFIFSPAIWAYDANITVSGTVVTGECRFIQTERRGYYSWAEGCPARSKAQANVFLESRGYWENPIPSCELPDDLPIEDFTPEVPEGYQLISEEVISESEVHYPAYNGSTTVAVNGRAISGYCYGLSAGITYDVDVHGGFLNTKEVKRVYATECNQPDTEYPPLETNQIVLFDWGSGNDRSQECSDSDGFVQSKTEVCQEKYRCVKDTCNLPDIPLDIDLNKEEVTSSWSINDSDTAQKQEICNADTYSDTRYARIDCEEKEYCVSKLCREPDLEFDSLADNQGIAMYWGDDNDMSPECNNLNGIIQQERHECVSNYRCAVTQETPDDCQQPVASYVVPKSGIFHEDIKIDGTSIQLHYSSRNAYEGNSNYSNVLAQGWTLSSAHTYQNGILYRGDGRKIVVSSSQIEENQHIVHGDQGISYIFDDEGRELFSQETLSKRVIQTISYNDAGRIEALVDRYGNSLQIQYDDANTTEIIAPEGQTTTLTFNIARNLQSINYADGSSYSFVYDNRGLMTEEVEPNGNRFLHHFNDEGKIIEIVDPENGIWSFDTLMNNDLTQSSMTLAEGDKTIYKNYSLKNNELRSVIIPSSGEEIVITSSADGLSKTTEQCGVVTAEIIGTDSITSQDTIEYQSISLPSGLKKETNYDISYTYNDTDSVIGRTIETTLGDNSWKYNEDFLAQTKEITSPLNRTVHYTYDETTGLIKSIKTSGLETTYYTYDSKGRITESRRGNRFLSYTYDNHGNLASQTDPLGKITRYSYDLRDRTTEITYPDGHSIYFKYDANGNMLRFTTPTPAEFDFSYNGVNKRISMTSPLGLSTQYLYDKQRRLLQMVQPSGSMVEYTYLKGERIKTVTPEKTYNFAYACGGKLQSVDTSDDEHINYSYDGSLITQVRYEGILEATIDYSYDENFMTNSITYAGTVEALGYDNDSMLILSGGASISRNIQSGLTESIKDTIYAKNMTYNKYAETESSFIKVDDKDIFAYTIDERNDNGQITKKTEYAGKKAKQYRYAYDDNSRLISVHENNKLLEAYTYDANGNRIHKEGYGLVAHPGKHLGANVEKNKGKGHRHLEEFKLKKVSIDSSYTVEDQLEQVGDTIYAYNEDGYLSSKISPNATTHYNYGTLGELKSVVLPNGTTVRYLHNANNQRVAKKVNGVIVEKYLWKNLTTLLAVYDSNDNLKMRFEYADGRVPYKMIYEGVIYYMAYDQVGTLKVVSDITGKVVKAMTYDSYGNIWDDSNPDMILPFGFAGGLYDQDTKLTRFGYRDYDAYTGKWTTKDPIGFSGGDSNLYGYVLGDPVNFIDPEGLKPPVNIPDNANPCKNGKAASSMSYYQFVQTVKSGGKWDYKSGGSQYENYGNYNFGYTAAAMGISSGFSGFGAGMYQVYSGTSQWSWYSSYFDDPNDQKWIDEGYNDYINDYYKCNCE